MDDYRVVIFGSRDFNDYELLKEKCDVYLKNKKHTHNVIIVSGHAKGADTLGEQYAKERGYKVEVYPAKWKELGVKAGFIRNEQMADISNAAIGFWDGESHGTKHMIDYCTKKGLNVKIVKYKDIK